MHGLHKKHESVCTVYIRIQVALRVMRFSAFINPRRAWQEGYGRCVCMYVFMSVTNLAATLAVSMLKMSCVGVYLRLFSVSNHGF